MTRTLTTNVSNILDDDQVLAFFAVKIEFPSGTLRMWTGLGEETIDSETYTGLGNLIGISKVEESEELRATGLELTLSGVPSSLLGTILTDSYQGSPVTVFMGFLTESSTGVTIVADPFTVYKGQADTMNINEDGENLVVSLKVENRIIALEERRNRRYTEEDQKISHSTDDSLRFIAGLQNKEISWGR